MYAIIWIRSAEGIIYSCLLYTSDAADERSSVDLGGRRIIKKKKNEKIKQKKKKQTKKKKKARQSSLNGSRYQKTTELLT